MNEVSHPSSCARVSFGIGIAVVLAGLAYIGLSRPTPARPEHAAAVESPAPVAEAPATVPAAEPGLDADQAAALAQQKSASDAALQAVGEAPYRGAINERPAFVSPIEWQILQAAARQKPDSQQALTRMVNQLRFEKQLEIWQQWPAEGAPAKRDALAQQLLQELPERVANQETSVDDARQLQKALLATLVADPQQRAARQAEEAARLPRAHS